MNPFEFHLKNGVPRILPIIDSYKNAVLVGLEVIKENSMYRIIFHKTLSSNHREEIHMSFIQYKQATHYFIDNFTASEGLENFISKINHFMQSNDSIIDINNLNNS